MKEIGKMVTCDRCGASIFCKEVEEKVQDGGYTRTKQYEDLPDGWELNSCTGHDLCPGCNEGLQELIKKFYGREAE